MFIKLANALFKEAWLTEKKKKNAFIQRPLDEDGIGRGAHREE